MRIWRPRRHDTLLKLIAGALATAAAMAAVRLLQAVRHDLPSLPHLIGDRILRETPGDLATEAIERFGHHAREGLVWSVTVALVAGGAALGLAPAGVLPGVIVVVTLLSAWLAPVQPTWETALLAASAAGLAAWLVQLGSDAAMSHHLRPSVPLRGRRRLLAGGIVAGLALTGAVTVTGRRSAASIAAVQLPARRLDLTPAPGFAPVAGLPPLITDPVGHYTVDINLARPRVDVTRWRLTLDGLVRTPRRLTFADVTDMDPEERAILLHCISNVPAGDLISCAAWCVVPLARVIASSSPLEGATHVIARAFDGYHESYRIDEVDRIFVAYAVGGAALPNDRGLPVRLLVPGRYGMRSVKWLTSLELVDEPEPGYWQQRGWDDEAVLRLGSTIDVPKGGAKLAGPVTVAGRAWGPEGVTAVELSADGGHSWRAAQLEAAIDPLAWRRWQTTLPLGPGPHQLVARALAGGEVQDDVSRPPHPSGASMLHRVTVVVA